MSARLPRPEPREAFRRELRARLLAEVHVAAEERSRRGIVWTAWLRPAQLRPVLAALVVAAILAGSAGTAAAGSLPGEPAFGLKRAVEQLQVVLAGEEDKVRLLAEQADRRLGEFERTASEGEGSPAANDEYAAAVERLREAAARVQSDPEAHGEAVAELVEAARRKHLEVLESLKDRISEDARRAVERAIDQAERIRGRPAGAPGGTGDDGETPVEPSESAEPAGPPARPTPPRGNPGGGPGGPPPGVPAEPFVPPPARPVEPGADR